MADGPVFQRWSKAQDMYLKDNWGRAPIAEIAAALGRTEKAITERAYKVVGTTLDRDPKAGRRKGRRLPR
ncbi:hypothetical protein [Thalassobaculum sp.]|uniref:hypothetical protein n=1 Tax=Thalassobaculum sp. TaxID=2022740 RepID=UPI0032F01E40